jgi:hypothetical protein
MKLGLAVVMMPAVVVSCASSSSAPEPAVDAGVDALPPVVDAASEASARDSAAPPGVNGCAGCTAQSCMTQLQACGSDDQCVEGLLAFNQCFGQTRDGRTCGKTFAGKGAKAATLWACMDKSCTTPCSG